MLQIRILLICLMRLRLEIELAFLASRLAGLVRGVMTVVFLLSAVAPVLAASQAPHFLTLHSQYLIHLLPDRGGGGWGRRWVSKACSAFFRKMSNVPSLL